MTSYTVVSRTTNPPVETTVDAETREDAVNQTVEAAIAVEPPMANILVMSVTENVPVTGGPTGATGTNGDTGTTGATGP